MIRVAGIAAVLTLLLVLAACNGGNEESSNDPGRPGTSLQDGDVIGDIERAGEGTPFMAEVRTLLDAYCRDGVLTLRTSREEVTSMLDCAQMAPRVLIEAYIGQPVTIAVQGDRLIMEAVTVGTLDFPAADPRVREIDGAP